MSEESRPDYRNDTNMGRKKIPGKKVSHTIRIKPENKERIKAEHIKIGPMVDKIVEELPKR